MPGCSGEPLCTIDTTSDHDARAWDGTTWQAHPGTEQLSWRDLVQVPAQVNTADSQLHTYNKA